MMKKRSILSVLAVTAAVLAFIPSRPSAAEGVVWTRYADGMARAKKLRKPVVVDFYASWCHWCKVMDRTTFADRKVVARLAADYVAVRIDMESPSPITVKGHSLSPQEYAAMLGVTGLPSVAFLSKEGEVVTVVPGYLEADTFLPLLGYIRDECYLKKVSFKDYRDRKTDCGKK
jgi:thiol:disulfide interchange protein